MADTDDEPARRRRAEERRSRIVIRKGRLSDPPADPSPIRGEAAISLATQLTRQSWAISGRTMPSYSRAQIPVRFVRWPAA